MVSVVDGKTNSTKFQIPITSKFIKTNSNTNWYIFQLN